MERRLDRIEKQLGGDEPERGQIAHADLEHWPPEEREKFLAADAAGDTGTVDRLVEAQTGVRPTRTGRFVGLIVDMPIEELDPVAVIAAADDIIKTGGRR